MRASKAARAAPRDADGGPWKVFGVATLNACETSLAEALRQAENLAALVGTIDPALIAGLAFALLGGPRH
jgi:hypothetical protein